MILKSSGWGQNVAGLGRIDVCFRRGAKVEGYMEFNFGEVRKREGLSLLDFRGEAVEGVSPPKAILSSVWGWWEWGVGATSWRRKEHGCCRDRLGFGWRTEGGVRGTPGETRRRNGVTELDPWRALAMRFIEMQVRGQEEGGRSTGRIDR